MALKHMALADKDEATLLVVKMSCVCRQFKDKYESLRRWERAKRDGGYLHDNRVSEIVSRKTGGLYTKPGEYQVMRALGLFPDEIPTTEWQFVGMCVARGCQPPVVAKSYCTMLLCLEATHDDALAVALAIASGSFESQTSGWGSFHVVLYAYTDTVVYANLLPPERIMELGLMDEDARVLPMTAVEAVKEGSCSPRVLQWYYSCIEVVVARRDAVSRKFRLRPRASQKCPELCAEMQLCADVMALLSTW